MVGFVIDRRRMALKERRVEWGTLLDRAGEADRRMDPGRCVRTTEAMRPG
jgi:hypothetical protein